MADANSINLKSSKEFQVQTGTSALDLLSIIRLPDSEQVFVGGNTGKIYHVDLAAEKPVVDSWDAHVSHVSSLVICPAYLVSAGSDHQMVWWDRETHKRVREVNQTKWIRGISLAPDHKTLASVCDDMVCRLWETDTGRPIRELVGHAALTPYKLPSKLYACRFSRDGRHLATSDQAGHAMVWEVESGKRLADIHAPTYYTHDTNGHTYGGIRCMDFSPDGTLLALGGNQAGDTSNIGGSKSLIQIYDWQKGQKVHDFPIGGNFFYERVQFHHEGKWLLGAAGAGSEQKIVLFDLEKKSLLREVKSTLLVFDMVMSERSDALYTVGPLADQRHLGRGTIVKWTISGS